MASPESCAKSTTAKSHPNNSFHCTSHLSPPRPATNPDNLDRSDIISDEILVKPSAYIISLTAHVVPILPLLKFGPTFFNMPSAFEKKTGLFSVSDLLCIFYKSPFINKTKITKKSFVSFIKQNRI